MTKLPRGFFTTWPVERLRSLNHWKVPTWKWSQRWGLNPRPTVYETADHKPLSPYFSGYSEIWLEICQYVWQIDVDEGNGK